MDNKRQAILEAAIEIAQDSNYQQVTQAEISKALGISGPLVHYHFGTMDNLRRDLMSHAIATGNLKILAQGIALRDPKALAAPETAKANAVALLSNA